MTSSADTDTSAVDAILPGRRRWFALAVLAAVVLLLSIDNTVLALAVPALSDALAPSAEQVLWIGDVYSLTVAGLLVLMGSLADRFGRKRVLMIGAAGFGAASVLAAFAPSAEMLILARVLLGIAGATLLPSTLSLIRNMFPDPAERTRAIAIWATAFGGGSAVGPLVGGVLLEHFWWGAIFLINVPVMVVVLVAGVLLLPESRDPHPGPVDVLSSVLSITTITPIVFAIKHLVGTGVDVFGVVAVLVGVASGIVFVRRQRRSATPMLDVDLFRIPAFSGAIAANLLTFVAASGLAYFFAQYLQFTRGASPLEAGLAQLPLTATQMLVVFVVGAAVGRLGTGRAMAVALSLAAVGLGVVAIAAGGTAYLPLGIALAAVGLGHGMSMTLAGAAILGLAPPRKAGAVSAITESVNELGIVLGIAVLGSVLTAVYRAGVPIPAGADAATRGALEDSLAAATSLLGAGDPALAGAQSAFVTAMQTATGVGAVLTAIAAVLAWRFIPSKVER